MFFRVKSAGSYQYLQIVHSVREGEKVRQQVFGTLGRLEARRYGFDVERAVYLTVCIGFLPAAAIEPLNVGGRTISFREPKCLISITSTEPWHSWATGSSQRAKRPWVHRAA